jgi:hypothetical protein
MKENIVEPNTRLMKQAALQSIRLDNTRKAILKLIEALGQHIPADKQWEIKKLIGRG